MLATYQTEQEINSQRDETQVAVIEDRLQQNLKDISFEKPYDLVIARWGLGYLSDEEVHEFLNKARTKLLAHSHNQQAGCMIFMETVQDEDKQAEMMGEQNLTLRPRQQYLDMFESCKFEVKMKETIDVREDYYPDVIFCVVPRT